MESLDLDPGRIVFPHRCMECGATPATSYTLEALAGLDVLLFAYRTRIPVEVPLCAPCARRKTWGRVGWFALILVGLFAPLSTVAALRDILGDMGLALAGVVVLPATLAIAWWARNREDRLYHRWFSPAWIVTFDPSSGIARLGLRDARTRQEVGVLSGVLDPSEVASPAGYREHGGPEPVPFASPAAAASTPGWAIPGWAIILAGLGIMGMSVFEYVEQSQGVLGLVAKLVGGLLVAGLGLAIRRGQRATPP
jgi:hypothetical protein